MDSAMQIDRWCAGTFMLKIPRRSQCTVRCSMPNALALPTGQLTLLICST